MCPVGGALFDGRSKGLTARLVCHCLLVEAGDGLVLVDTGFGMEDMRRPHHRLSTFFLLLNRIQRDEKLTALHQVTELGFSAHDVRHIVLTHLDFDHAGGLSDFPNAVVHVMEAEHEAASRREGFIGRRRYRPEQWKAVRDWRFYGRNGGSSWFGFDAVRSLDGLPPEILLIPLPGHSTGHAGVAVGKPGGWILNAGDAYFYRHELNSKPRSTAGLSFYQRLMDVDYRQRLDNQARLRELVRSQKGVSVFCSHDQTELDQFCQAS
jgi:glyoxylase-like metal-dependent hydrolase (beta-lactamase superfamily II)